MMNNCRRFLGHKWDKWEIVEAIEKTESDGRKVHQLLQRRKCEVCNFHETDWLPEVVVVQVKEEHDDGE